MAAFKPMPWLLSLPLIAAPTSATVQTAVPQPRHLGAIGACRAIVADPARLACFDREAAALIAASQSGQLSVVDRTDLKAARRSLFGFQLPKLPFFAGDKSADDVPDRIETTIVSAEELGRGRYRMTLVDQGAVWENTDSPMRLMAPRAGDKIVIRKGAVGSYFLRIDGQVGVKGRRIK